MYISSENYKHYAWRAKATNINNISMVIYCWLDSGKLVLENWPINDPTDQETNFGY